MGGMIDEEEDSSEDEEDEAHAPTFEGGYNPADFEDLAVSADIKELFQYIGRYTPQQVRESHEYCLKGNLLIGEFTVKKLISPPPMQYRISPNTGPSFFSPFLFKYCK